MTPKLYPIEVQAKLIDALEAVDRYFNACAIAWESNDGRLVDDHGQRIARAEGLDCLCDVAALKVTAALIMVRT